MSHKRTLVRIRCRLHMKMQIINERDSSKKKKTRKYSKRALVAYLNGNSDRVFVKAASDVERI